MSADGSAGQAGLETPPHAPGRLVTAADAARSDAAAEIPSVPDAAPDLVGRTAELGRRAAMRWRHRPLRDLIVSLAFALVGLWIALTVLTAALTEPGDAAGVLIVIALSAFFVLRGLRRKRTPYRDPS